MHIIVTWARSASFHGVKPMTAGRRSDDFGLLVAGGRGRRAEPGRHEEQQLSLCMSSWNTPPG